MVLLWPSNYANFQHARILIEFVKINQVAFEEGMKLNMGQILSIPLY
jgi:prolipoprotein diacylglyceryltransferase